MRVIVLFSGGKDSTYAAWWAVQQGWSVVSLLTALPAEDSMMFHHPNAKWTRLSAEAMGLPHQFFDVGGKEELESMKEALASFKGRVDAVVAGALASDYQKTRIDRICHELGFKSFAPLWHKDQENLLREMVREGFRITVVGCFAEGLGEKWLGREIDSRAVDDLSTLNKKFGVSPAGEGGEWESFVTDSPAHKSKVRIVWAERKWDRNSGIYNIRQAELSPKGSIL